MNLVCTDFVCENEYILCHDYHTATCFCGDGRPVFYSVFIECLRRVSSQCVKSSCLTIPLVFSIFTEWQPSRHLPRNFPLLDEEVSHEDGGVSPELLADAEVFAFILYILHFFGMQLVRWEH